MTTPSLKVDRLNLHWIKPRRPRYRGIIRTLIACALTAALTYTVTAQGCLTTDAEIAEVLRAYP